MNKGWDVNVSEDFEVTDECRELVRKLLDYNSPEAIMARGDFAELRRRSEWQTRIPIARYRL